MADFHRALFSVPQSARILRAVRVSVAATVLLWTAIGPLGEFYSEEESLLYAPAGLASLLPPIGGAPFRWLKALVILGCVGMMFRWTSRAATLLTAVAFGGLNGYMSGFSSLWNYNTHLNTFLVALLFAPKDDLDRTFVSEHQAIKDQEIRSAIVSFMRVQVAVIYLQAGLAKVIHGGLAWPVETPYVHMVLLSGVAAPWLRGLPNLVAFFGYLVVIGELALPVLFLMRSTQRLAVVIAICLHVAFYMGLGISFWHLWILFPALFLIPWKQPTESNRCSPSAVCRLNVPSHCGRGELRKSDN